MPSRYNLCTQLTPLLHVKRDTFAHFRANQEGRDHGAGKVGAPPRFLRETQKQAVQDRMNRLLALRCPRQGFRCFAKLNLGHHAQHMIFAFKVVEEGALTYISGFGNLLHCDRRKAALGKQLQRAPEEPEARFSGTALAPARAGRMCRTAVNRSPG